MATPKLKISINDNGVLKALKMAKENNIPVSMTNSQLIIDAKNKKNNDVLVKIMETVDDYLLTARN